MSPLTRIDSFAVFLDDPLQLFAVGRAQNTGTASQRRQPIRTRVLSQAVDQRSRFLQLWRRQGFQLFDDHFQRAHPVTLAARFVPASPLSWGALDIRCVAASQYAPTPKALTTEEFLGRVRMGRAGNRVRRVWRQTAIRCGSGERRKGNQDAFTARSKTPILDLDRVIVVVREDSPLKIAPIPHLIALKLYAGGHKSKADIIELLVRNPDLELDEVRSVCARYGLGGLEELIAESRAV